jgi:hypothetical protein
MPLQGEVNAGHGYSPDQEQQLKLLPSSRRRAHGSGCIVADACTSGETIVGSTADMIARDSLCIQNDHFVVNL